MPSYIAYTDVEYATGSALGQTILEAQIDRAEAWLAGQLAKHNATADTTNGILQEAVMERTIAFVYTREQMDGTRPGSQTLDGTLTQTSNIPAAIAHHIKQAEQLVKDYAREELGDPWAESSVDAEATVVRQDHAMGTYQLDQSTVKEYHDRADEYGTQDGEETT